MKNFIKKISIVFLTTLLILTMLGINSNAIVSQEEKDKYPIDTYGASEEKISEDGFKYYTYDYGEDGQNNTGKKGSATIVGTTKTNATELIIPASIENYEVTTIWYYAFADMTSLEKVIINSDTRLSLNNGAFMGCTKLKDVEFNGPVCLYKAVFSGTNIYTLKFPAECFMYVDAFEGMNNLRKIYFTEKPDVEKDPFINALWDHDVDGNTGIMSEDTKYYFKKNVTIYGYVLGEEFDNPEEVACLTPKAFADRFEFNFVDLAIGEALPDSIEIDMLESELVSNEWENFNKCIPGEEKILEILQQKGFDSSKLTANVCIFMDDIYSGRVTIFDESGNTVIAAKDVSITYSNTNKHNEKDAKTIEEYMKNCETEKEEKGYFEKGNVQAMYLISINHIVDTIEQDLPGTKVVTIWTNGTDSYGDGNIDTTTEWWDSMEYIFNGYLYITKDDMIYSVKLGHLVYYPKENNNDVSEIEEGISVDTGKSITAVINAKEIGTDNENYAKIVENAKTKGYGIVYKAYELKLIAGKIENGIDIIFDLGTENNGKEAIILHLKADGNYEEFKEKVEDGKVKITVNELSPFLVGIKKDESYKLGDVNQDGKVNAQDATLILKYLAKKATLTEEQKALADTDKDGKIKASDAVRILKYVTKKITEI